jgi:hypothetical protein
MKNWQQCNGTIPHFSRGRVGSSHTSFTSNVMAEAMQHPNMYPSVFVSSLRFPSRHSLRTAYQLFVLSKKSVSSHLPGSQFAPEQVQVHVCLQSFPNVTTFEHADEMRLQCRDNRNIMLANACEAVHQSSTIETITFAVATWKQNALPIPYT